MKDLRTILVTTDLSDTSTLAFEPAFTLARRFGATVVVVYVVEDQLPAYMDEFTAVPIDTILEAQTQRARRELDAFLAERLPEDIEADRVIVHGVAHLEILRVADERGADLIAMATHGRGFVSHALFGSTTERVVRKASCAVLTVRDPGTEYRR
jgi:nucleotide-binding universal stress UspA family protein